MNEGTLSPCQSCLLRSGRHGDGSLIAERDLIRRVDCEEQSAVLYDAAVRRCSLI